MARIVHSLPRETELRLDGQLRADIYVSAGDDMPGDTAMGEDGALMIVDNMI